MFVVALGNISIPKVNAKILYDTIELGLYKDLMEFNSSLEIYGLAQAVRLVKDWTVLIVKEYVNDDVSITFWVFNTTTTKLDIDLGNPIILGCQPVFTGSDDFPLW